MSLTASWEAVGLLLLKCLR